MTAFQRFIEINDLKKGEIATFLGVSNAFVTQLCSGKRQLPAKKMALIKANTNGWDISMFDDCGDSVVNNVNSVVNSKNFRYDSGISATEFLAYAQENQRQMGQLIESISLLSRKLK